MYTKGFWIIFASYEQIGSKVVWGKCVQLFQLHQKVPPRPQRKFSRNQWIQRHQTEVNQYRKEINMPPVLIQTTSRWKEVNKMPLVHFQAILRWDSICLGQYKICTVTQVDPNDPPLKSELFSDIP